MSWKDSEFLNWRLVEKNKILANANLKWSFGNSFLLQFCEVSWLLQNVISHDSWSINAPTQVQEIGCLKLLKNHYFINQNIVQKILFLLLEKKVKNFNSVASFFWQQIIENTLNFSYARRSNGEICEEIFYDRKIDFAEIGIYFEKIGSVILDFLKITTIKQTILKEKFVDFDFHNKTILLYFPLVFVDESGFINIILFEKNLEKNILQGKFLQQHFSILAERIKFVILGTDKKVTYLFSEIQEEKSLESKINFELQKSYELLFEKIIPDKIFSANCEKCKFLGFCFPEKLSVEIRQKIAKLSAKK